MGIIAGVLFTVPAYRSMVTDAAGQMAIPFWVVLAAHAAIGLGTLSGGWRIIHTMGSRITKLQPVHGFAAETGAAGAVFLATVLGIPVSTTHAITGAIVGVGATRRLSAVRWGVAGQHRLGVGPDHPRGRAARDGHAAVPRGVRHPLSRALRRRRTLHGRNTPPCRVPLDSARETQANRPPAPAPRRNPPMEFAVVLGIIATALIFDYINGFHDAANSIATVVSTRVLSPGQAVIWAAFFNFVAAFGFGTAVAKTIGSGMIDINSVTLAVIFSGLFGAIVWDLITWYFGLPTSSSHALIGGYAGAAIAKAGLGVIIPAGWTKTLIFIVVSPLIGLTAGLVADGGHLLDVPATPRRPASTTGSGSCSSCPPPCSA